MKDECAYLVGDAITEFSMRQRVSRNALLSHVQGFLYRRLNERDGRDPYYSLVPDVSTEDNGDGEDEDDDKVSEDGGELDNDMGGDSEG